MTTDIQGTAVSGVYAPAKRAKLLSASQTVVYEAPILAKVLSAGVTIVYLPTGGGEPEPDSFRKPVLINFY